MRHCQVAAAGYFLRAALYFSLSCVVCRVSDKVKELAFSTLQPALSRPHETASQRPSERPQPHAQPARQLRITINFGPRTAFIGRISRSPPSIEVCVGATTRHTVRASLWDTVARPKSSLHTTHKVVSSFFIMECILMGSDTVMESTCVVWYNSGFLPIIF